MCFCTTVFRWFGGGGHMSKSKSSGAIGRIERIWPRAPRAVANPIAAEARDEWRRAAIAAAEEVRKGAARNCSCGNFLAEDLRTVLARKVGEPPHPNGWGALIKSLRARRMIEPNGETRHMKRKSSHGRLSPAYRWTHATYAHE